jgi:hypothetical protein
MCHDLQYTKSILQKVGWSNSRNKKIHDDDWAYKDAKDKEYAIPGGVIPWGTEVEQCDIHTISHYIDILQSLYAEDCEWRLMNRIEIIFWREPRSWIHDSKSSINIQPSTFSFPFRKFCTKRAAKHSSSKQTLPENREWGVNQKTEPKQVGYWWHSTDESLYSQIHHSESGSSESVTQSEKELQIPGLTSIKTRSDLFLFMSLRGRSDRKRRKILETPDPNTPPWSSNAKTTIRPSMTCKRKMKIITNSMEFDTQLILHSIQTINKRWEKEKGPASSKRSIQAV